jgi:hypothetical protein
LRAGGDDLALVSNNLRLVADNLRPSAAAVSANLRSKSTLSRTEGQMIASRYK